MASSAPMPDDFMRDASNRLESLTFDKQTNRLRVLDQLQLPFKFEHIELADVADACSVIKKMQVRGAPMIAVVGILGLYVEIQKTSITNQSELSTFLTQKCDALIATRPTAVNLRNALNLVLKASRAEDNDFQQNFKNVQDTILRIYDDEQDENRRLIWNGFKEITSNCGNKELTLMTICNTGSLATCSWGTALGVIVALHQAGCVKEVFALETRPYNQGARLTTTELRHYEVPFKLITDSMAAWTMKTHKIDAILVGADQVTLNGDTANKIGTYMLAVLAKHHNVPFYPVVPFTTVALDKADGSKIAIEERPGDEMRKVNGAYAIPSDTPVWNPAFDVTPGFLLTKIITDFGNFTPTVFRQAAMAHSESLK